MTQPIKLLIVDDHPVFRQGLRDVLETDPRIQVVGEAADGEIAIELAYQLSPDVILMDINLPTINGLQVTRKIRSQLPHINIIMITGYDDAEQVFHALRSGASAYCPKDITPEALLHTIFAVHEGLYVVGEKKMTHDEVIEWVDTRVGRLAGTITNEAEDLFVPLSPEKWKYWNM